MQYMMIFSETADDFAQRNGSGAEAYWAGWNAFIGAMFGAGIAKSGDGLQPPDTGTIVRLRDGKRIVQDGPLPDTKEMLAGYLIIDTPDLDTALEWAAKCPAASTASVEIRPVMPPPTAAA